MYVMAWVFTLAGCVLLFNTLFPIDVLLSSSPVRPGAVAAYFTQALIAFGVGAILFGITGLADRVRELRVGPARNAGKAQAPLEVQPPDRGGRAILVQPVVDPSPRPPRRNAPSSERERRERADGGAGPDVGEGGEACAHAPTGRPDVTAWGFLPGAVVGAPLLVPGLCIVPAMPGLRLG